MSVPFGIICQAGKILSDPAHFTTGTYARDKNGTAIAPNERRAVKWDAYGVIYKVMRLGLEDFEDNDISRAGQCLAEMSLCASCLHKTSLTDVNDRLGHAAVLEVMRLAARRLKNFTEQRGRE